LYGGPTAKGSAMTDTKSRSAQSDIEPMRIPFMQRLLDNPFLLLFLGVAVPTLLYILWGIMELIGIPVAP